MIDGKDEHKCKTCGVHWWAGGPGDHTYCSPECEGGDFFPDLAQENACLKTAVAAEIRRKERWKKTAKRRSEPTRHERKLLAKIEKKIEVMDGLIRAMVDAHKVAAAIRKETP